MAGRRLLSVLDERKLRKVLSRMLDEERFLSPHGIRSLSRSHLDEPSPPTDALGPTGADALGPTGEGARPTGTSAV